MFKKFMKERKKKLEIRAKKGKIKFFVEIKEKKKIKT